MLCDNHEKLLVLLQIITSLCYIKWTSVHLVLLGVLKDNESLSEVPMDIDTWK